MKAVVWNQRLKQGVPFEERDNALAGYTLGRLRLIGIVAAKSGTVDHRAISNEQYDTGMRFASVWRAYAVLKGTPSPHPKSASAERVGPSVDGRELSPERVAAIRDDFRRCWDAMADASREMIPRREGLPAVRYGWRMMEVVFGVCVENWDVGRLDEFDCGALRTGLNAMARALNQKA